MTTDPPSRNPYATPDPGSELPPRVTYASAPSDTDSTGGVIPYKNPHALIAYYLAVFSLIPCFGILLGIPAVILGIIGLKKRQLNPKIRGSLHAWIGIIMGGLMSLVWVALLVGVVVAMAAQQN